MAPRYMSKEWIDAVVQKANSDEKYLEKKFDAALWTAVTDCPDGHDVSIKYTYKKWAVINYEYTMKPAPLDFRVGNSHWDESISPFRAQAPYDTWAKIHKKEITVITAMSNNLYIVEGDMVKSVAVLANVNAFSDVMTTVPCVD